MSSEALAPVLRGSPATEDGKEDWIFGGLRRSAGATGSCPWDSTGRLFSPPISSASKSTTPLEGEQPFDIPFDFPCFVVAGPLDCNYNLAII